MLPSLIFASRNPHKFNEMSHALQVHGLTLVPCGAGIPEIPEDGASLAENAARKAIAVARGMKAWALGDDTGLFVDALGGAPGVRTSRYAGSQASAEANRQKLLEALDAVPDAKRAAHFECCLALADPSGEVRLTATGRCSGRILAKTRGELGFGYDGLFLILEYRRTLAELSLATKSVLSHRGRAVWQLAPKVVRLLGSR